LTLADESSELLGRQCLGAARASVNIKLTSSITKSKLSYAIDD
jgi:hypothetical protein